MSPSLWEGHGGACDDVGRALYESRCNILFIFPSPEFSFLELDPPGRRMAKMCR
jgi:hypothetical protein